MRDIVRLGSPLTEANLHNTKVKQNDFNSKYLVWNGDETTAFFHSPVVQIKKLYRIPTTEANDVSLQTAKQSFDTMHIEPLSQDSAYYGTLPLAFQEAAGNLPAIFHMGATYLLAQVFQNKCISANRDIVPSEQLAFINGAERNYVGNMGLNTTYFTLSRPAYRYNTTTKIPMVFKKRMDGTVGPSFKTTLLPPNVAVGSIIQAVFRYVIIYPVACFLRTSSNTSNSF